MGNTNTTPATGITLEVGKRYVTDEGWITPPYNGEQNWPIWQLISEYVESAAPQPPDTFRRDLVAKIYVAMIGAIIMNKGMVSLDYKFTSHHAIQAADALIEAMEEEA